MDKIFNCPNCERKFTLAEAWAQPNICKIEQNSLYKNWKTITVCCPYCKNEIIKEMLQENL